ncbi:MAG: DegT/DnrJ/EryC1/StrS family aminotransferase [Nitrososphaerota archaeon]|nr:DegT/DnrJ/EryC1/StrS family aminotransferase [Nitrososphaerota archaeon]
MKNIPINKPIVDDKEKEIVERVISERYFVDQSFEGGKYVRMFEEELANFVHAKHAVAVNSGTSALIAALLAARIEHGDEVIVPSLTFIATANAVRAVGARPVFADIDEYYTLDPAEVRKKLNKRVKAVIPVHLYGHTANMGELNELAEEFGIHIIEDAAQSLGSTYDGRHTSTIGDMGCISFYPGKVITTGEGGAVITDDDGLADRLKTVRNHGFDREGRLSGYGLNFRMQQMSAAIGYEQVKKLPKFLKARERNAYTYIKELEAVSDKVMLPPIRDSSKYNWYLFTVRHPKREAAMRALKENGIDSRIYYDPPVHKTPTYISQMSLPLTEMVARDVLSLPANPLVSEDDIVKISQLLKQSLN